MVSRAIVRFLSPGQGHRPAFFLLVFLGLLLAGGRADAFTFEDVVARAQQLAGQAYVPPVPIPRFMRELDYDAYQGIRFDEAQSLWRESNSRFQVMLFSPGLFYTHPVEIHVVDAEGVHRLPCRKSYLISPIRNWRSVYRRIWVMPVSS